MLITHPPSSKSTLAFKSEAERRKSRLFWSAEYLCWLLCSTSLSVRLSVCASARLFVRKLLHQKFGKNIPVGGKTATETFSRKVLREINFFLFYTSPADYFESSCNAFPHHPLAISRSIEPLQVIHLFSKSFFSSKISLCMFFPLDSISSIFRSRRSLTCLSRCCVRIYIYTVYIFEEERIERRKSNEFFVRCSIQIIHFWHVCLSSCVLG